MDRLPPELVIKIATFLSLGTLRNLRLTSSWLANITLPVFAHTIGVLATVDCVKDLQVFLTNTAIANNVKTLKIYHAVWPKCQRNQWATHPLLSGGERKGALRWDDPAVENAYCTYSSAGTSRPTVEGFRNIFTALPALNCITIEHIKKLKREKNTKYTRLVKNIWLQPHFADAVDATVEIVFRALAQRGGTTMLQVNGKFIGNIQHCVPLPAVLILVIGFLNTENPQHIRAFLDLFPKLKSLSLKMTDDQTQLQSKDGVCFQC